MFFFHAQMPKASLTKRRVITVRCFLCSREPRFHGFSGRVGDLSVASRLQFLDGPTGVGLRHAQRGPLRLEHAVEIEISFFHLAPINRRAVMLRATFFRQQAGLIERDDLRDDVLAQLALVLPKQ